jgi:aspartyl-tRNA(Asn)/glutamyl-tRNA(Gln) amidotransferase subunit B
MAESNTFVMPEGWEAVIGLEVHAQLKTESKLFSSAPHAFGAGPNTQTTEVDIGHCRACCRCSTAVPSSWRSGRPSRWTARFTRRPSSRARTTSIRIFPRATRSRSTRSRTTDGEVPSVSTASARDPLTRIHMEEDAAKNIHDDAVTGGSHTRPEPAGALPAEIVSTPNIHSPEEAGAYLRSLRQILRYLDVSDADMEKGQFRCDANVSVRRVGDTELGTRTELKNLNSFRFVERAIASEIRRQVELLESGGKVKQQTMHWDDRAGVATPMRTKEQADDYRYFPDPDLPPLRIDPGWLERKRAELPELPHARRARYVESFGLPPYDAAVLTEDRDVSEFFEAAVALHGQPKTVSNWIMRDVLRP